MAKGDLLRRYESGEHAAVWADMMALGPRVREAPHRDDAWAVACETMRRARHNVELIVRRLDQLAFSFWDGAQGPRRGPPRKLPFGDREVEGASLDLLLAAMFAHARSIPPAALTSVMVEQLHNIYRMAVWPWQDSTRLMRGERHPADAAATALFETAKRTPPAEVATTMLAELDRLHRAALERLFAAWKEREASRPATSTAASAKPADHLKDKRVFLAPAKKDAALIKKMEKRGIFLPLSLRVWIEEVGSVNLAGSHPRLCFWEDASFPGVHADPLMVAINMSEIEAWLGESDAGSDRTPLDVVVGWDAPAKARLTVEDIELDFGYTIAIPNPAADAILAGEAHATGFVDYLRAAFRFGGFPGWERQTTRPERELSVLTADLLPI